MGLQRSTLDPRADFSPFSTCNDRVCRDYSRVASFVDRFNGSNGSIDWNGMEGQDESLMDRSDGRDTLRFRLLLFKERWRWKWINYHRRMLLENR